MAKRYCIFWTGSPAAGAVGGLLAGAIIKNLNGKVGLHGWQWLFIIGTSSICSRLITRGCSYVCHRSDRRVHPA